jgi:hypothetical protein
VEENQYHFLRLLLRRAVIKKVAMLGMIEAQKSADLKES